MLKQLHRLLFCWLVLASLIQASLYAANNHMENTPLAHGLSESLKQSETPSPLILKVTAKTYQSCLPCHGAQGEGNRALRAPALAGQHSWYLERQLKYFREGIRGTHEQDIHGAAMRSMAMLVSDMDKQTEILKEIEDFPAPKHQATLEGDLKAGKERYEISCANCHGDEAEGIEKFDAPRLSNLQDWYIARQLMKFQLGYRGEHQGDTTGSEMRPMAMAVYTEKELTDVASYISQLGNSGKSDDTKRSIDKK